MLLSSSAVAPRVGAEAVALTRGVERLQKPAAAAPSARLRRLAVVAAAANGTPSFDEGR